jgi:hypothetical protein
LYTFLSGRAADVKI